MYCYCLWHDIYTKINSLKLINKKEQNVSSIKIELTDAFR